MTEAALYDTQVDAEIASARLSCLQARHTEILDEIMNLQLDKVHEVYSEELKPYGKIAGRSDDGKLVFVEGSEELLGKIVPIRVVKTSRGALDGVLV